MSQEDVDADEVTEGQTDMEMKVSQSLSQSIYPVLFYKEQKREKRKRRLGRQEEVLQKEVGSESSKFRDLSSFKNSLVQRRSREKRRK